MTRPRGMNRPRVVRGPDGKLNKVVPSGIRFGPETMEVFAWVGIALAWAQGLERTLAAYLILAQPTASASTRKQFRDSIRDMNRLTLFRLVKLLRRHVSADEGA